MVIKHTHIIGTTTAISIITGFLFIPIFSLPFQAKADSNTNFQVNVVETLTVSITAPDNWANGAPDSDGVFLRNKISLSVASNNSDGFAASMYATDTDLTNTTSSSLTIPTLASNNVSQSNIPNGRWGFSLDNSTYSALVDSTTSPITVLTNSSGSNTQDIYFGAKADLGTASGTYTSTVVISVVTGVVTTPSDDPNNNPITPTDPVRPTDDPTNDDGAASYTGTGSTTGVGGSNSNGTTVYTTTSSEGSVPNTSTKTTTEISAGDTTSSYANPQGVTNIKEGTPLATGLAVTSAIAATTGIVFFIIAKRREDDDDEDEY